jgi:serine protease Do
MKKILTLLVFTIFIITFSSCSNQDILIESHLRLVVVHETSDTSFGSAVIYDEDESYYYALTNEHVIDDSTRIEALDYLNLVYGVTVIKSDESIDLAIISIEKENELEILKFAKAYQIDDEVIAVGYPSSIYKETHGYILEYGLIDYEISTDVITHSADIDHGSSGGVLVNNDYEIVGINFAGYVNQQEVMESYAIPLETIAEFINQ